MKENARVRPRFKEQTRCGWIAKGRRWIEDCQTRLKPERTTATRTCSMSSVDCLMAMGGSWKGCLVVRGEGMRGEVGAASGGQIYLYSHSELERGEMGANETLPALAFFPDVEL